MLLLILGICIGLIILGAVIDNEKIGFTTIGVGFIIGVVDLVIVVFALLFYPHNIDKKLEMYQEENLLIEEKVKNTVSVYMDYEYATYEELLKDMDIITLIVKYPALNSNQLVMAEIETYKENSKIIKDLREKQIDKSTYNWWLYFGN